MKNLPDYIYKCHRQHDTQKTYYLFKYKGSLHTIDNFGENCSFFVVLASHYSDAEITRFGWKRLVNRGEQYEFINALKKYVVKK